MWTNRLLQCAVLLSLFRLVGADAHAQPKLLIEIHDEATSINLSHLGAPLYMAFSANSGNGDPPNAILEGLYDSDDVGMTFHATAENVEAFQIALSAPLGEFGIITSNTSPGGGHADELWLTGFPEYLRQFVPRLGVGLTGYDLTAVTQAIDRIEYRTTGINTHVAFQEQTFRLYGQPIPEPSSAALFFALHSFVLCFLRVRTGRRNRCRCCRAQRAHRY
jgi:hypothetical protein